MDKDRKLANKAKFVMKFGSDAHQERVLKKRINATATVRWNAAINGPKHHLDILVKDRDPDVRAAVAVQGHKEHLDKLLHDKDETVRMKIPKFGHDDHLDHLMHDPSEVVRSQVAGYGKEKHWKHLENDPVPSIARMAQKNLETKTPHTNSILQSFEQFTKNQEPL